MQRARPQRLVDSAEGTGSVQQTTHVRAQSVERDHILVRSYPAANRLPQPEQQAVRVLTFVGVIELNGLVQLQSAQPADQLARVAGHLGRQCLALQARQPRQPDRTDHRRAAAEQEGPAGHASASLVTIT